MMEYLRSVLGISVAYDVCRGWQADHLSLGLVQTEKRGVQKVVYPEKEPRELFETAKSYLVNPVFVLGYIVFKFAQKHCIFSYFVL